MSPSSPPSTPLPAGFRVCLAPQAQWLDATTLVGGAPRRRVRLSAAGVQELSGVTSGNAASSAGRRLVRWLLDAGLLCPQPLPVVGSPDVTVVVPVRDRSDLLGRALDSLTEAVRVVVVDDGSRDPGAVKRVADARGAEVLRIDPGRGPAGARNAGAAVVTSTLTAFLDSDCQAPPGWLSRLSGHFDDPLVAAVAPRVRPAAVAIDTTLSRYLQLRSPLDMGSAPGPVGPGRGVRYVPSAALLLRTSALGSGFDEALRWGEDVDLIWRLAGAGWQIRYDPTVVVAHREPSLTRDVLRRRFRYGMSAGPLAVRHGSELAPAIVSPEVAISGAVLLAGRPRLAGALGAAAFTRRVRLMRGAGLPRELAISWSADGLATEMRSAARFLAGPGLPAAIGALLRQPATGGLVLLAPALSDWSRSGREMPPRTFVALALLDDAAYAAGVVFGSLKSQSGAALVPRINRTPRRRVTHTSTTLAIVNMPAALRNVTPRSDAPDRGQPAGECHTKPSIRSPVRPVPDRQLMAAQEDER